MSWCSLSRGRRWGPHFGGWGRRPAGAVRGHRPPARTVYTLRNTMRHTPRGESAHARIYAGFRGENMPECYRSVQWLHLDLGRRSARSCLLEVVGVWECVGVGFGNVRGFRRFCECWFRRIIELLIGFNRCWLVDVFILNSEFLANWVCLSLRIGYRIIFNEMLENLFNVFFITTNEIFIKHVFFQIKIILCFSLCNKSKIW